MKNVRCISCYPFLYTVNEILYLSSFEWGQSWEVWCADDLCVRCVTWSAWRGRDAVATEALCVRHRVVLPRWELLAVQRTLQDPVPRAGGDGALHDDVGKLIHLYLKHCCRWHFHCENINYLFSKMSSVFILILVQQHSRFRIVYCFHRARKTSFFQDTWLQKMWNSHTSFVPSTCTSKNETQQRNRCKDNYVVQSEH